MTDVYIIVVLCDYYRIVVIVTISAKVLDHDFAIFLDSEFFEQEAPLKACERRLTKARRELSHKLVRSKNVEQVITDKIKRKVVWHTDV